MVVIAISTTAITLFVVLPASIRMDIGTTMVGMDIHPITGLQIGIT